MSDVMVVVKKTVFEDADRNQGPLKPGSPPLRWDDYQFNLRLLDKYLEKGDRIFLFTARPNGRLWLAAVYENVRRRSDGWYSEKVNRTPIIDITKLIKKFRFHTGNGLTSDLAKLGNSLQSPRMLTASDIDLLETEIAKAKIALQAPRLLPLDEKRLVSEGERVRFEIERSVRNRDLVKRCLERDDNTCRHCGFTVGKNRFPTEPRAMSRVVHVHHIHPIHDGRRKTALKDLVTLCPTCHAVAHALSSAVKHDHVPTSLLAKHYKPSVGKKA